MQRTREFAREHELRRDGVRPPPVAHRHQGAAAGRGAPRAERAAINAPMQGTAADLVKLAMIAVAGWLDREQLATKLVLQVHDELVLEVPRRRARARARPSCRALMTGVAALRGAARRRRRRRAQLGARDTDA